MKFINRRLAIVSALSLAIALISAFEREWSWAVAGGVVAAIGFAALIWGRR